MHIVIIGAGIVGLTSAWQLARDGHNLTVIDRNARVGDGASHANGAQLSYSYVAPLAAPDVLRSLPKYLFSADSPMKFVPEADPAQWSWLLKFLSACNAGTSAASTAKLLALARLSRNTLHALIDETEIDFDYARNGKLVIQSSVESQQAAEAQMRLQASMGCEQYALTAAECIALEPGLESVKHRLVGGIHTPSEEVGDCRKLCEGMHDMLAAGGTQFLLGTAAELAMENGRVAGVDTAQGRVTGDLYVVAAGTGSRGLARQVRQPAPVLPVRGYSISAPVLASNRAPVRSITDSARKTVYAPLGDRMRTAGFAEIGGPDERHVDARIATLSTELQAIFPGACATTDLQPWIGQRPLTPTCVPMIGPTRIENLFFNIGQGKLGFTLSCGSAALLADLVAGRKPAVEAADYAC
jgi:D-amino-acid dehydrogenase